MRFCLSTAFLPVDEVLALARAADELGYHAIAVPDHVVDLEELRTPYPYTADGSRRWSSDASWPDPWVLIGALSAITTRLHFFTSVYVAALRSPYVVAKAVGTASVISGGRVALGVGVGWCREEFDLLEQPFADRGRRTDEAIELMKELWRPGVTAFDGEFFTAPRLRMEPSPEHAVPIYVGGLSERALRRAATHQGWIGDVYSIDDACGYAARLAALRTACGNDGDFAVITALSDAFLPEHFARAEAGGVTDVWTMPWAYYYGLEATVEQKLESLARFRDDIIAPLATS